MMLFCCGCGKNRKDEDTSLAFSDPKLASINKVLVDFLREESNLGLKEVSCITLIEKSLSDSNLGEVPKKTIISIFKPYFSSNNESLKNFLTHSFFYTDRMRTKFDFYKIVLFDLLYSGGREDDKANFLFNVLEND